MGGDMGRDEDAGRQIRGQVFQDGPQNLSAACRPADGNDVLPLMVHRSPAFPGFHDRR